MKNIKIVNNCSMLFVPIRVEINNTSYKMKRNDAQFIALPKGEYELTVRQHWAIRRIKITIEDNDVEIFINRMVPEFVFSLMAGIIILLGVFYLLSIISFLIPSIFIMASTSFLIYYSLFRSKKYFKVKVRNVEPATAL
ncbi:MAG: hypothetical protein LBC89_04310 [Bacteroidales bacterium]|jgi:hypothetical protein|nr:hypothetical protein [Bacteroidales bacterium]